MKGNIQQNKTKTMRRVGLFYVLTNPFKLQFNTENMVEFTWPVLHFM